MLQNKAVRSLAGFDDKHPTSSIYKSYNILKLDDMVKLQIAMFVHRHFNNNLPLNLRGYFTYVNKYHSIASSQPEGKLLDTIITYQDIDHPNYNVQLNISGYRSGTQFLLTLENATHLHSRESLKT